MSHLDKELIFGQLSGDFNHLEYHPSLDSTNNRAANLAIEQLPALIVCDHQYQGRGRHQNVWLDEEATALTFSLAIKLPQSFIGINLAVSIGIVTTLTNLGLQAKLKWPNDLLGKTNKKFAGILIEIIKNNQVAICGVGVNVFTSKNLQEQIPNSECLAEQQADINRNELLVELVTGINVAINHWQKEGMSFIKDKWEEYTVHQVGDAIVITNFDGSKENYIYQGLTDSGELIVKDKNNNLIKIASAEVNLESISN